MRFTAEQVCAQRSCRLIVNCVEISPLSKHLTSSSQAILSRRLPFRAVEALAFLTPILVFCVPEQAQKLLEVRREHLRRLHRIYEDRRQVNLEAISVLVSGLRFRLVRKTENGVAGGWIHLEPATRSA